MIKRGRKGWENATLLEVYSIHPAGGRSTLRQGTEKGLLPQTGEKILKLTEVRHKESRSTTIIFWLGLSVTVLLSEVSDDHSKHSPSPCDTAETRREENQSLGVAAEEDTTQKKVKQ